MASRYACSRGVLAPILLPFSTAASPALKVFVSGASHSGCQSPIATPQYPIAQLGSNWITFPNSRPSSSYQNECNIATARSNWACAAGVALIEKCTRPKRDSAGEASPDAAHVEGAKRRQIINRQTPTPPDLIRLPVFRGQ